MDEGKCNEEYAETFRHELGHFVDAQLGRPSLEENFEYAIEADMYWFNSSTNDGITNKKNMLLDLSSSEVIGNRYISGILSGLFLNDTVVRKTYYEAGASYYCHKNEYWFEITGPKKAVEREVFANLFAIYAENDKMTVKFIEKWFPNMAKRFLKDISK